MLYLCNRLKKRTVLFYILTINIMFTMFNVYRRVSQKSFNGTKVLYRKARINTYEIDTWTVGEWFKNFAKVLADNYDVRAISATTFNLSVSVLTEDGKNLIFEYCAETTK